MSEILEGRKEDGTYYQGAFWIIADSFKDVLRGNFKLDGVMLESDYDGNYLTYNKSQKNLTHQRLWRDEFADKYNMDKTDYTYYPRGRVAIYKGTAFIHLHSKCNIPAVIDAIIDKYGIDRLDIEFDMNDTYQGNHYDFKLE